MDTLGIFDVKTKTKKTPFSVSKISLFAQGVQMMPRPLVHRLVAEYGAQWLIGKKRNIVLDWNIINLNRNIGYKDENTYTLRSQQPFTLEDSSGVLTSIYTNEVGLFGMLLTWPFFGSVTPAEPFKEGQSMTFSRSLSSKLHVSTNLSIGFRF